MVREHGSVWMEEQGAQGGNSLQSEQHRQGPEGGGSASRRVGRGAAGGRG